MTASEQKIKSLKFDIFTLVHNESYIWSRYI